MSVRPRVLMITGAYFPETSGASLQCRQLIRSLGGEVDFRVLTTSTDPALPWHSEVDGIPVRRIAVDVQSRVSKAIAIERMASSFLEFSSGTDIVHLHGFSQKTLLVVALARLTGKRIVIKLTSVGHDDPAAIWARGRAAFWAYAQADCFIGVTPRFGSTFAAHGLDAGRFEFIPNGVDLDRFKPVSPEEQIALLRELGLRADQPVVLFVGFFSSEKRPDVLFEAWASLMARGIRSTLVLVGATTGSYYEIDSQMAPRIRERAAALGLADHVVFVERADAIERYYRIADVFALPTIREGLPNVLLEAMATAVPPVITLLEGVTDWIVSSGVNGELVPTPDAQAFAAAIERLLVSRDRRSAMGAAARAHVTQNFAIESVARKTLGVYHRVLNGDQ